MGQITEESADDTLHAAIFAKLFEASGVADWRYAIEIGGSATESAYTERILHAADGITVFGFDVRQGALDTANAQLKDFVATQRLSLHQIDSARPDQITQVVEEAGALRQVDAVFSIDAMRHVDLQQLAAYWVNAAQVLRPGGRILMTLADAASDIGFQALRRDLRKVYRLQGRTGDKLEYLDREIVVSVLGEIGFDIVELGPWSHRAGRPARDLYLIAELARTGQADAWRDAIHADPEHSDPILSPESETYSEMWDRDFDRIGSGASTAPRVAVQTIVIERLSAIDLAFTESIVEIGGGDTDLTRALLSEAHDATVLEFTFGDKAEQAYRRDLSLDVAGGRLALARFASLEPDIILRECDRRGLTGTVGAFVSLNVLQHIGLHNIFAYLVNAALVLKPGGKLLINVADATSPAGVQKLLSDIRPYFAYQGRPCPRFQFLSPAILRDALTELGFGIDRVDHGIPSDGIPARDLHVVATMTRPERAAAFRADIRHGAPGALVALADDPHPARLAANNRIETEMSNATKEEQDMARALGQAYWRQVFVQTNPDMSRDELRARIGPSWNAVRRDYTRLGFQVMRQLGQQGYVVQKADGTASRDDD